MHQLSNVRRVRRGDTPYTAAFVVRTFESDKANLTALYKKTSIFILIVEQIAISCQYLHDIKLKDVRALDLPFILWHLTLEVGAKNGVFKRRSFYQKSIRRRLEEAMARVIIGVLDKISGRLSSKGLGFNGTIGIKEFSMIRPLQEYCTMNTDCIQISNWRRMCDFSSYYVHFAKGKQYSKWQLHIIFMLTWCQQHLQSTCLVSSV